MKKDIGTALLRMGMGALMLPHGFNKLTLLLSRQEINFPAVFGLNPALSLTLAVFAEVVCAALLIIGFKTKTAALSLIFTMTLAVFYVLTGSVQGDLELTLLYLFGYIAVYVYGGGKYSADTAWQNFKNEQAKLQLVEY